MAGNSQRKGAIRKAGSKKTAAGGTGGKNRRSLEGKGPTPKAEDRTYHVAHKRKELAERSAAKAALRGRPARGGRKPAPRDRTSGSTEIAIGRNSVLEALRVGTPGTTLYIAGKIEADDRIKEIIERAIDAGIEIAEVPKHVIDDMAEGSVHQGVALQVPPYDYANAADYMDIEGLPRVLMLDGITDPRNLGAIMRSAAAFGAKAIIIPERRAAGVTVAARKTAAGAASRIPVARATNLVRTLEAYKDAGFFIVGLDGGGDVSVADSHLRDEPLVIVVGSEGQGLGRLVRETCDQIVSIPIASTTESLNASVAASLALYALQPAATEAAAE